VRSHLLKWGHVPPVTYGVGAATPDQNSEGVRSPENPSIDTPMIVDPYGSVLLYSGQVGFWSRGKLSASCAGCGRYLRGPGARKADGGGRSATGCRSENCVDAKSKIPFRRRNGARISKRAAGRRSRRRVVGILRLLPSLAQQQQQQQQRRRRQR